MDTAKIATTIANELTKAGFTTRKGASNISESRYVEIFLDDDLIAKVRVSLHELPASYAASTYDVGPHGSGAEWTQIVTRICERHGKPVPAVTRAVLTRHANRAAKMKEADAVAKLEWEAANPDEVQYWAARTEVEPQLQALCAADPLWPTYNAKQRKRRRQKLRDQLIAAL